MVRYGSELKCLPQESVCEAKSNIDHMLIRKTGGFVTLHPKEIENITENMLSMICIDVRTEPTLSTTPNKNDELWPDISVRSFRQGL